MTSSHFKVLAAVLVAGGCSQILGISDYEIDNGPMGEGGDTGQGGDAPISGKGGKAGGGDAGAPTQAGEGPGVGGNDQGGMPGQGGEPGVGGSGQAGEGGAPPTLGELVPCDSVECCDDEGGTAVGVELLGDPGFDAGPSQTTWTERSTNDEPIITLGTANIPAIDGNFFAWLAGIVDESSDIESENFTVPSDAGWIVLSGHRWFEIDSLEVENTDFAGIGFYDPNLSDPLELPFFWDTTDGASSAGETTDWVPFEASWDAAPHQGETRYLLLRGAADDYYDDESFDSSNYLFDAVSLKAFSCYK